MSETSALQGLSKQPLTHVIHLGASGCLSDYTRARSSAGGLSRVVTSTSHIRDRWAIRYSVKPSAFLIFSNLLFVSFVLSLLNDTVAVRGHILAPRQVPAGMLSQQQG